jgi:hypothetical protein
MDNLGCCLIDGQAVVTTWTQFFQITRIIDAIPGIIEAIMPVIDAIPAIIDAISRTGRFTQA